MVPVIASSGACFQGAWEYYFHDKQASTSVRVAWTHTRNLLTDCAEKAWKVMAYTAKSQTRLKEAAGIARSGRKLEKPVFAFSLSWHPEQKPDKETMLEAANQSLEALGLSDHETMIAAHQDEPQPHIHIIVNRCHPTTGQAASTSHSKRKLSDFAREWERKEGKVYCMKREENYQKRQKGQFTKNVDPVITNAWANSTDARGFIAGLKEHGYELAQGRKRLVVVDAYGKTVNPIRHLIGVRAAEFHQCMREIDHGGLLSPDAVLARRLSRNQTREVGHNPSDAQTINRLITRHHEEWAKLAHHFHAVIQSEKDRLLQFYQFANMDVRINTIAAKLHSKNLFLRIARRLLGIDRRLSRELNELLASKDDAQSRLDEATTKHESERDTALRKLKESQAQETEDFMQRLSTNPSLDKTAKEHPRPGDEIKLESPSVNSP